MSDPLRDYARTYAEYQIHLAKKKRAAWEVLARKDINYFIPYVGRVEGTSVPVRQAPIHTRWQALISAFPRLVFWSFPEGGKCQPAGERVRLVSGEYRAIETLRESVEVVVLDPQTMTYRTARTRPVEENGLKPVVKITLRSGRIHRSTAEHPVYLPRGWVPAVQVKRGDFLATARHEPETLVPGDLTSGDAELLGYLTGDGCLTRPARVLFTKDDLEIVARISDLAGAHSWVLRRWGKTNTRNYDISSGRRGSKGVITPAGWVRSRGLTGGAHAKRVPSCVFQASNIAIAHYIGAYFACDGHVPPGNTKALEFSSVSRGLLEDVQLLLLRFGIVGRVAAHKVKYNGEYRQAWRLLVGGAEYIAKFLDSIPIVGHKGRTLASRELCTPRSCKDLVPSEWALQFHRPLTVQDRVRLSGHLGLGKGNQRAIVQKLLQAEPNEKVACLASDAVFWDEVVDVEFLPPEMTYALGVADPAHCYLSSGVISHNTWNLIFRVLWELGRDPEKRIVWVSGTHKQAEKPVKGAMQYIEKSEELHRVFPKLRPSERKGDSFTKHSLTIDRDEISKDASLETCGERGSIIGARIDFLILDDVLSFENTRTQANRDTFWEWYHLTLASRLTENARVIVVGNAWHCMLPGQLVLTSGGLVRAEELTPAHELLVGPGQWERPLRVWSQEKDTESVTIKVRGFPDPLQLTQDHCVLTEAGVKEAGALCVGDRLLWERAPLLDGIERAHEPRIPARPIRYVSRKVFEISISRPVLGRAVSDGTSYRVLAAQHGVSVASVWRQILAAGLETKRRDFQPVAGFTSTPEWWRFAGYWVAEGVVDSNRMTLTFGRWDDIEEQEFAHDAAQVFTKATGIVAKVLNDGGKIRVRASSRICARWLVETFGKTAVGKRVVPWVEQVSDLFAKEFFLGYWRGDGCTDKSGARFTTASQELAYGLQRWLANLGVPSLIYRSHTDTGYSKQGSTRYELRLLWHAARSLGLPAKEPTRPAQQSSIQVTPTHVSYPIVSIERVSYKGLVYDVTTSTGWFYAPQVKIHNCDDFMHRLAAHGAPWRAEKTPVISPTGELAWPEKWSLERVEAKKQEVGPLKFARQYLCEARDDSSSRFQRAWLEDALARGKGRKMSSGLQYLPSGYRVYTGVDLGVRQHTGSDPTVIFTIAIHPDGTREVLNIVSGLWQAPEIVSRIYEEFRRFFSIIYVEDNQAQDFIRQWLAGYTDLTILAFNTGRNKLSPDFGVESLAAEFAMGKWVIPEGGTPEQKEEINLWLKEMYYYDPKGHSGDRLMAAWIAREGARQGTVKPEVGKKRWF